MKKEDKAIIIEKLGEQLKEYAHFYLVDVTGMNAEATSALRRKAFGAGIKMVVVKNTLLHKAFEASDVDFSALYDCLKGTTAVFFCETANVPAKLTLCFCKKRNCNCSVWSYINAFKAYFAFKNSPCILIGIKGFTQFLCIHFCLCKKWHGN